ncbi:MAG: hypothetical protein ABSF25_25940 [Bryobacteraceae bacterium]
MNLKKATLAAAVCASVAFVYPNLAQFIWLVYERVAGRLPGLHILRQMGAMCTLLSSLGLAAFLIVFFREQCGHANSQTRRTVAGIGAALMGVHAALQGAALIQTISRQTPAFFAYYNSWAVLTQMALSGVAASALWTVLLIRFAAEESPLQGAGTRPLPLILAADLAVALLWRTYSFVPTLRAMWSTSVRGGLLQVSPGRVMQFDGPWEFWVSILTLALENLVWISLFVFLLSVWRYQARSAALSPQDLP